MRRNATIAYCALVSARAGFARLGRAGVFGPPPGARAAGLVRGRRGDLKRIWRRFKGAATSNSKKQFKNNVLGVFFGVHPS
jgi:hypothetical protein